MNRRVAAVLTLVSVLCTSPLLRAQDGSQEEREKMERQRMEEERARREKGWGDDNGPGQPGQPGQPPMPPMPPGQEGMRPKGGERMMRRLTDEEVVEVKAFLKEMDPNRLAKIEEMTKNNPDMAMGPLGDAFMEMQKMKEMQKRNPEEYARMIEERKLDSDCFQLANSVRDMKSDDPARSGKLSELREKLGKLFDVREANKERQVAKMEEELNRLKETIRKRKTNKDAIVDTRLKEMTGSKEENGW